MKLSKNDLFETKYSKTKFAGLCFKIKIREVFVDPFKDMVRKVIE